ncbi:hypothetical protein HHI36_017824 [Cryptolaemus montrouzieri]|uniref:Uncharacterized protein n=1 Tax=Cryptolaemus montrouzieri TaxID=559131 RepID=A0ABD2NNY7_9CUCU
MASILGDKIFLFQYLSVISVCVLTPSVPSTILKSGGNMFQLGCLMSISSVARMISKIICEELLKITGKQQLLKFSLIASTLLNGALWFASSSTAIIINRVLFVLIYQVPMLTEQLYGKQGEPKSIYRNPQVQRITATLIGCATVGSLIDRRGFYVIVMIATTISIATLAIFLQMQPQEKTKEKKLKASDVATVFSKSYSHIVKNIRDTDIHFANWDALLIKSLLVTQSIVVFILFVVMVIFVFRGNGAWVNTTAAYQLIVVLSIQFAFNKLKNKIDNYANPKQILENSALICTIFAMCLAFAPSYPFYLVMFIPLVIARTFVENYFVDVFELKKNQKLGKI